MRILGQDVADPKMPTKARVEALVDGIFAVAMTLLVLDIKLSDGVRLDSNAHLIDHLASLSQAFLVYVLSFVVLAMYWVAHSYQFHIVEKLDRPLLWINFGFLLLTTTVPFTTNLVSTHANLSLAVIVYAGNLLLLSAALLLHIHRLRNCSGLATRELTPALGRGIERRLALSCTVPLVAAAAAPFSPSWGMRVFFLLALLHFVPHRSEGAAATGI